MNRLPVRTYIGALAIMTGASMISVPSLPALAQDALDSNTSREAAQTYTNKLRFTLPIDKDFITLRVHDNKTIEEFRLNRTKSNTFEGSVTTTWDIGNTAAYKESVSRGIDILETLPNTFRLASLKKKLEGYPETEVLELSSRENKTATSPTLVLNNNNPLFSGNYNVYTLLLTNKYLNIENFLVGYLTYERLPGFDEVELPPSELLFPRKNILGIVNGNQGVIGPEPNEEMSAYYIPVPYGTKAKVYGFNAPSEIRIGNFDDPTDNNAIKVTDGLQVGSYTSILFAPVLINSPEGPLIPESAKIPESPTGQTSYSNTIPEDERERKIKDAIDIPEGYGTPTRKEIVGTIPGEPTGDTPVPVKVRVFFPDGSFRNYTIEVTVTKESEPPAPEDPQDPAVPPVKPPVPAEPQNPPTGETKPPAAPAPEKPAEGGTPSAPVVPGKDNPPAPENPGQQPPVAGTEEQPSAPKPPKEDQPEGATETQPKPPTTGGEVAPPTQPSGTQEQPPAEAGGEAEPPAPEDPKDPAVPPVEPPAPAEHPTAPAEPQNPPTGETKPPAAPAPEKPAEGGTPSAPEVPGILPKTADADTTPFALTALGSAIVALFLKRKSRKETR